MRPESMMTSFLRSSLVSESPVFDNTDFVSWFRARRESNALSVRTIPFGEMDEWRFDLESKNLAHVSGRFFRIEGVRVTTNFGEIAQWDQPIINQPEVGILGILAKRFSGILHFLMQAKSEPGNIHTLQLSPTVQATRSNYTQVHSGRVPSYLEHFTNAPLQARLVDQLQSEQGGRFLRKRNRNMIVETAEEIPVLDDFRWLTLGEIKRLHEHDNLVNMDARSVVSCVPYFESGSVSALLPEESSVGDFGRRLLDSAHSVTSAMHSMEALLSWISEMKVRHELVVEPIGLSDLGGWTISDSDISHESEGYFSVIGVQVEARNREVGRWTQPMIKERGAGLNGFITQLHAGVLHFLVQAKVEPGNLDIVALAPTVSCSNVERYRGRSEHHPFLDRFLEARPDEVRYSSRQSEEGGRFFRFDNRNVILEMEEGIGLELPPHFVWMSLGQLLELLKHGYLSVDARTLLSCLSWI